MSTSKKLTKRGAKGACSSSFTQRSPCSAGAPPASPPAVARRWRDCRR
jgi:hypothetical protein